VGTSTTKNNKWRSRARKRGRECPQSQGLPTLPDSTQQDGGDLAAPRLLPFTSSPGREKGQENWDGDPAMGPGCPHRHGPTLPVWVIVPAHPLPSGLLEFRGTPRQTGLSSRPAWDRLPALGRSWVSARQQQLHPNFGGNSQVISKLMLRDYGQGPKTTPKLVKTLA